MAGREVYGKDFDSRRLRAVVSKVRNSMPQVSLVREHVSNQPPEEAAVIGVGRVTTCSGDEPFAHAPGASEKEVPVQKALKRPVGTQIFQLFRGQCKITFLD